MRFAPHSILFCCLFLWKGSDAVLNRGGAATNLISNYRLKNVTIHKVSFTQKGYIQFLRYINHVPTLTDYTFCIWVRSHNLTYSHPLLSYSKHEEERLIRVWISPKGTHINLEILTKPVFKIPVQLSENQWYHICQSWSYYRAFWSFYLNGKLKASGYEPKLRGVPIKEGGDIVVGQEYTDFDKGLDDGIEGDAFGFNFVLSPTAFGSPRDDFPSRPHYGFHNDVDGFEPKTTGLQLVRLSYDCALGKGAPLEGPEVLISWTKTPVRVFGGAILKSVPPFCT